MGETSGGPGELEDLYALHLHRYGTAMSVSVCVHALACISGEQGTERGRQPACPGQQVNMRLQHESNRRRMKVKKKKSYLR